jgi:hypothetical protein
LTLSILGQIASEANQLLMTSAAKLAHVTSHTRTTA